MLRCGTHLFSVTTTLFNWSQNLCFHGQNSHFLTLVPCAPCRLATCLVRRLGQVEQEVKEEAGDMSWVSKPTSRSVVYLWGISLPTGLGAGGFSLQPLRNLTQKGKMFREEYSEPRWLGWVPGTSCAYPLPSLLQEPTNALFDEGQLWLRFSVQTSSHYDRTHIWIRLSNSQHKEENLMGYTIRYVHKKKLSP